MNRILIFAVLTILPQSALAGPRLRVGAQPVIQALPKVLSLKLETSSMVGDKNFFARLRGPGDITVDLDAQHARTMAILPAPALTISINQVIRSRGANKPLTSAVTIIPDSVGLSERERRILRVLAPQIRLALDENRAMPAPSAREDELGHPRALVGRGAGVSKRANDEIRSRLKRLTNERARPRSRPEPPTMPWRDEVYL